MKVRKQSLNIFFIPNFCLLDAFALLLLDCSRRLLIADISLSIFFVLSPIFAPASVVVETHKTAADSFLSRPTQTLNHTQKNQSETAAPSAQRDYGSQVTAYEISDSTSQDKRGYSDADAALGLTADEGNKDAATASVQKFVEDTVNVCVVTPGCLLDVDYVGKPPAPGETRKEGGKVKKGAPGGASAVSGALTSGLGFGTSAAGGGSMLAASASGMGAGSESDAGATLGACVSECV